MKYPMQLLLIYFCGFIFLAVPCQAESDQVSGPTVDLDAARTTVLALDSARQGVLKELAQADFATGEVAEYRDFIAFLNSRMADCCKKLLAAGGDEAIAGLPCVFPGKSTSLPALLPPALPTREPDEELDKAFSTALADFDDMLLKEEEKMASRVPSSRESGTDGEGSGMSGMAGSDGQGAGDSQGASQGLEQGEGQQTATEAEGTESQKGNNNQRAGMTGGQNRSTGSNPGNLPPPEDDDIVARQLREAAQKETDPELKKKLWEEYWKYKGKNP